MGAEFKEWIPVHESLPKIDGLYETMVKPLLSTESFKKVQRYTQQPHMSISGWTNARVTHWRSCVEASKPT